MTALLALGMPNGIEWVVILFVVLILFGAKRLPELARGLGKSMSEFKKAREDFESELHQGAASVSASSVTVRQPVDRQLAYNEPVHSAAATGSNIEQQVRELQEQLREVQRQNQLLQASATAAAATHGTATTHPLPTVATPSPAAAPAQESSEPPRVSVQG
ncbi:MAG: twin-arginine translocase TatA/TatE family subunit [Verrucomicrobia bacterium]|nr:twin-arginine translocase TatA/TatE family subunit [Verrucomicrobiota bacterium]